VHDDALPPEQRAALSALKPAADRGFYLAGGTGLCLRLGHRRSFDLDLFRDADFDPDDLLRELQAERLPLSNARTKPATLWIDVEGVRVSFMRFPYPCILPAERGIVVPVASLEDIAAMKIEAIASRGARKDFYDLYFICQHLHGLDAALAAFEARFASAHPDIIHRLKALTYFEDAEREPEPALILPLEWRQVREYFEAQLQRVWVAKQ
jgi:Nucleotidyl transferase AbiEii toxin, Type IV TA system